MGGIDAWAGRMDGAGGLSWLAQLGTAEFDYAFGAAAGAGGGLIVGGYTLGSMGGQSLGQADCWVARLDERCGSVASFCAPSTSSIPGCAGGISATGTPSISNPSLFTIHSGNLPGAGIGVCFFSMRGAMKAPLGTLGGNLCIVPPLHRTQPQAGGGSQGQCSARYSFDLTALMSASSAIQPGDTVYAEIWARDIASPDGFVLTDGLWFSPCM
jgi:hypothetical protein